jgi:hypothetical protein
VGGCGCGFGFGLTRRSGACARRPAPRSASTGNLPASRSTPDPPLDPQTGEPLELQPPNEVRGACVAQGARSCGLLSALLTSGTRAPPLLPPAV